MTSEAIKALMMQPAPCQICLPFDVEHIGKRAFIRIDAEGERQWTFRDGDTVYCNGCGRSWTEPR